MLPKKLKIKWSGQGKVQTINTLDYINNKIKQLQDMLDKYPHIPKYHYDLELEAVTVELAKLLNNEPIGQVGSAMEKDIIKEFKYYSTYVIFPIPEFILDNYNVRKTTQNQYKVVIKAKNMAEANRKAKELIDARFDAFRSGFTYELSLLSHRNILIECDKHEAIIYLSENQDIIVPLKEIRVLMDKKES